MLRKRGINILHQDNRQRKEQTHSGVSVHCWRREVVALRCVFKEENDAQASDVHSDKKCLNDQDFKDLKMFQKENCFFRNLTNKKHDRIKH